MRRWKEEGEGWEREREERENKEGVRGRRRGGGDEGMLHAEGAYCLTGVGHEAGCLSERFLKVAVQGDL